MTGSLKAISIRDAGNHRHVVQPGQATTPFGGRANRWTCDDTNGSAHRVSSLAGSQRTRRQCCLDNDHLRGEGCEQMLGAALSAPRS